MAYSSHTFQSAATGTGNGTALALGDTTNKLTVQIDGITTATITFEASVDGGTTYDPVLLVSLAAGTVSTTATADGLWRLADKASNYSHFRTRISSYTSGTITVKGRYQ